MNELRPSGLVGHITEKNIQTKTDRFHCRRVYTYSSFDVRYLSHSESVTGPLSSTIFISISTVIFSKVKIYIPFTSVYIRLTTSRNRRFILNLILYLPSPARLLHNDQCNSRCPRDVKRVNEHGIFKMAGFRLTKMKMNKFRFYRHHKIILLYYRTQIRLLRLINILNSVQKCFNGLYRLLLP